MRRCSPGAVLLIALLPLAGCGGGAPGTSSASTTSGAASSSTGPAQSSTGGETGGGTNGGTSGGGGNGGSGGGGGQGSGGNGGGGGGGDKGFAYVPWGPDDAPIPEQYQSMAAPKGNPPHCDDVSRNSPGGDFWDTVVAVCRAITEGGPWPTAVPDPPAPANDYMACLDRDIVAMMHRALDWHERHPNGQPKVVYSRGSAKSECQTSLYNVAVGTPETDTPSVFPVTFQSPGLEGRGVSVTVDGEGSDGDVDDAADFSDGLTPILVHVTGGAAPRSVRIRVDTSFGKLSTTVQVPGVESDLTQSGTSTSSDESSDEPASETTS
jgi:hypothetical protein